MLRRGGLFLLADLGAISGLVALNDPFVERNHFSEDGRGSGSAFLRFLRLRDAVGLGFRAGLSRAAAAAAFAVVRIAFRLSAGKSAFDGLRDRGLGLNLHERLCGRRPDGLLGDFGG